jgi:transposase
MEMRQMKGLELAARKRITWDGQAWSVPSQTTADKKYRVTLSPERSCTCEDFVLEQKPCKHVWAALYTAERDHGGSAIVVDTDAVPKKPTYRQNWPAYNKSQLTEKHRFQVLLYELGQGIVEPDAKPTGRTPIPLKDAAFACAFKVYSTLSTRRFACDLEDAFTVGYLTRRFHPQHINALMEDERLTPLLTDMIIQASLPLRAIERDFAPDSSGFSASRFVRWFDEKYGVERSGHDWVKVHIMTGVKTNIVTAIEIKGRDAGDSPILPELLKTTAKTFRIDEVSADKGYSSVENLEAVAAVDAFPFIAFKANATGGAGGLWAKIFGYYTYNREEFLKSYHKRSNVESTFSMVKAKFRDHVRSRTDTAMKNELLCKFLCHNICCVIQSQCELGIESKFWTDESDESPAVLKMPARG